MKQSRPVLGVDPGINGGIACVCGLEARVIPSPFITSKTSPYPLLNTYVVDGWFEKVVESFGIPELAFFEQVQSFPTDSRQAAFTFGWVSAMVCQFLQSYGFVTRERTLSFVPPKVWQSALLADRLPPEFGTLTDRSKRKEILKRTAIEYVQATYPSVSLLATEKSRVSHSGMADALCVAAWGAAQGAK